jgi:hypothetical protein
MVVDMFLLMTVLGITNVGENNMNTQDIQNLIGMSLLVVGMMLFVVLTQILEVIQ